MIRVRPIHHTADPAAWAVLLETIGAARVIENGPWSEFDTASGSLALSEVDAGDPREGATLLGFVSTDLDAQLAACQAAGVPAARTAAGHADAIAVEFSSGKSFLVDSAYREPLRIDSGLRVMQIWYQLDLTDVRRVFEGLGLAPRVVADDPDGWADYIAPGGGLAAQHPGSDVHAELSFEYEGDLDELASRVADAGLQGAIVDEAYNRTLRIASPDGAEVWINGTQDDLYGYHREG